MIKKRFFGALLALLGSASVDGQTTITLINDDFEAASNAANVAGSAGTWSKSYFGTLAAYPYNEFFIQSGCTANNLISGTQTMQVTGRLSSASAVCAYQNINAASNPGYACLVYKQVDATGLTTLQLSYKWRCNGQANADYGNLMYSTNGTTWNVLGSNLQAGTTATQTVTNYALPTALEGTIFYLGWRFTADATTTAQPGLSLDDIVLTGQAPAAPRALGTPVLAQVANPIQRGGNIALARLTLPVSGTIGTLALNSLTVASANTANADVTSVKLWSGSLTNPTSQLATASFSGATVTFSGLNFNLPVGNTYLWISYDIAAAATLGDSLGISVAAGGMTFTATGGATSPGTTPAAALVPARRSFVDYCLVNFATDVEPITNVTFAGINSTTSAVINGTPAQEYMTGTTATVMQGQSYTMSVQGNTNGNFTSYISVFADWNQDGDFLDADESYNLGSIANSTGVDGVTATGSIAVPATATAGTTRLRIVKAYATTVTYPAACNTTAANYGQSEDYKMLVNASNLPVSLGSFNGRPQGSANLLSWNTLSETNNDRFEVERSADGTDFRPIGTVKGNPGNTPGSYQYADAAPERVGYYRLKQVDVGGGYSYSSTIRLENKAIALYGVALYPNPAGALMHLQLGVEAAGSFDWTITSLVGASLQQGHNELLPGENRIRIALTAVPAGSYLLKGQLSNGNTIVRRFTKE